MTHPVSSGAVGFSMVPDWPVNQPAKTTPSNSPSIVAPLKASPQTQSPQTQSSQTQSSQTQSPQTPTLWQRTITELPPELLAMIFDYLEFDDIRHVNATCLAFREVVTQYNIQELSYFAQLPQSFREQYQQNASWQRKYLHLHPFATSASLNNRVISFRNRIIKNLPKLPALLCLATLGKMEQCPSYHPVERYKVILPLSVARYLSYRNDDADPAYDVCFSPSSRYLLFYGSCLNDARILSRNDQGQWAEAQLNWSDNSGSRVITGANFTACEDRLLTISADKCVNTLQPAHCCWEDVGKVTLSNKTVKFSPSGKFMATYSTHDTVIWRLDENNDWLKMEVCGLCPEVIISQALFSPSEQHVALRGSNEITVLSLNDRGAWSAQQLIKFSRIDVFTHRISYARFSQVADQLLVGICSHSTSPGRVSIFSPEPSGKWQEAIIFPYHHYLEFSSAGKYFFSKYTVGRRDLLLWPRPEKLSDWSLNPFPTPHFDAASKARLNSVKVLQHKSFVGKVQFSPSDSHILVSSHTSHLLVNASTVAVYLWGKNQAGEWSVQTFTDHCTPAITPCFSLSGLHVLTCNPSISGILGRSNQKQWSLKGVIKQHGLLKAYFNPLSEHEVVILSRTDNDTNITLTVWEITGTPD